MRLFLRCALYMYTAANDLDVRARTQLWKSGLDYNHGTGHGIGYWLNVHEGSPKISNMLSFHEAAGLELFCIRCLAVTVPCSQCAICSMHQILPYLSSDWHTRQSILSILLCLMPWEWRIPLRCPTVQCLSRQCLSMQADLGFFFARNWPWTWVI